MSHPLTPLLDCLHRLFAAEDLPGDHTAAQAITSLDPLPPVAPRPAPTDLTPIQTLLATSPHADLAPLLPLLQWRMSGKDDGRIRPDIAEQMLTAEIIGPTGLFPAKTNDVKLGLFYQGANLDYVNRVHEAEEKFIILAGTARWSVDHADHRPLRPGQSTFHPSMAPHSSITDGEPTLAAWRWTGEIGFHTYKMIG